MQIFVYLLDEGTDAWRPVNAEHIRDDLYRIPDVPSSAEKWEFGSGDCVRCEMKTFADKVQRLAAREKCAVDSRSGVTPPLQKQE